MLWNVTGANARKKIRLSVIVLHIDESALGLAPDNETDRIGFLKKLESDYK